MRNIILCGFMGCGKTTVGKLLSDLLQLEYIDLDPLIETIAGKSIPSIFNENGETAFRDLEHNAILSLAKRIHCIVSTGGGALTCARNLEVISPEDTVIFLDAPFDVCYQRIKNSKRPLVNQKSYSDLQNLFNQRYPWYINAASFTINADTSPLEVAKKIMKCRGKHI